MDGGAWQAIVHRVAKSRTRLSNFTSLHFTMPLISARSKASSHFYLVCQGLRRLSFWLTIEHLKIFDFFLLDPTAPDTPPRSWELLLIPLGLGVTGCLLSEPGGHREYFLPIVSQSVVTLILGTTRVFYPSLGYQITVLSLTIQVQCERSVLTFTCRLSKRTSFISFLINARITFESRDFVQIQTFVYFTYIFKVLYFTYILKI